MFRATILLSTLLACSLFSGEADKKTYLATLSEILKTPWPKNRAINIVCHGHSVPAGYFKTPHVDTFNAYPHLFHVGIKQRHPHAVVNVIVTAIGGENSLAGAARFEKDVLSHNPDLILLDYALNDRRVPLGKSREAWTSMIQKALAKNIKVILLTPTGDTSAKLDDPQDPLNQNAAQIRELAAQFGVGLADSLDAIREHIKKGGKLDELMSQINHPNRKGHDLVVERLMEWVP
jgi:lysophospholipase L1-like esterase